MAVLCRRLIILILVCCIFSCSAWRRRRRRRSPGTQKLCVTNCDDTVSHIKAPKDHQQQSKGPHPQPQPQTKDNDYHQPHNEDSGNQPGSEDTLDWILGHIMYLCILFPILPYLVLYRNQRSKTTVKSPKEAFRLDLLLSDQDLQGEKALELQLISDRKEQSDTEVRRSVAVRIDSTIDPSFDADPDVGAALNQLVKEMKAKMLAFIHSLKSPLKTRKYDCFIIYSSDDEDFVYNKLIPFFKKNNIKYCEHQEHFELGKDIFANANSCILCSRRVVAVLSKSFFESGFCTADLNAARGYAAENNVQDFVISVKITDCDIPDRYADMKRSTYADLSEDVNDSKTWSQIRKAFTDVRLASVRIEMSFECHNEPDVSEVVPGQEM